MKPRLKLQKPVLYKRVGFAIWAGFIFCFASLFIVMPLAHIVLEVGRGNVPWSLVGFACLSLPFGGLMMWLAARYRVWILPYQFTVDFSQKTCGYLWRDSWMDQVPLDELKSLVSAPAWSERVWPWVIYAEFNDGRERKAILNSHKQFGRELDAFSDCLETCETLASYLEVPIEFDEWSEDILAGESERRTRRRSQHLTLGESKVS